MLQHRLKIAGVGRYLPAQIVGSDQIDKLCGMPTGWSARATGVLERRRASDETASFMGGQAAREALSDAGLEANDLDLIINASGTVEQAIPDTGALIQRALGLGATGIPAMSVNTTCLSFLVGLDVASLYLASGRYRNILIVSSDISSCGLNYSEPESAALMGDAAAAVVVTVAGPDETAGIIVSRLETFGDYAYHTAIMGAGTRKHPNAPGTVPEDNLFHMDGKGVLRAASQAMPPFLERLRPGLSRSLEGVDLVIPHQASSVGLELLRRYNWPREKIAKTLDFMGNCVATSIPATLYHAVRQQQARRGDTLLLLGTGAGLSLGGLILVY